MNTLAFTKSASFYDVLYRAKKYETESKQIHTIIRAHRPLAKTLVDLGCGTGEHAVRFAKRGYMVTGVDMSPYMLRVAKNKSTNSNPQIIYKRADICSYSSPRSFDVAVSLFHVCSYLLADTDISRFFTLTYKNLKAGGLFIFDCWHGPGVLLTPPTNQTKRYKGNTFSIVRKKYPTHDKTHHRVQVLHDTTVTSASGTVCHYKELHSLRYFFPNEIRRLLTKEGFSLLHWGDINNNFAPPQKGDWDVFFVAQKPFTKKGKEK